MQTKTLRLIPLFATVLFAAPRSALADEWIAEGRLSFGARYSDNPTMVPDVNDPESTQGTVSTAAVEFERQADNRNYSIRPRVTRNWYPDRDLKDAEHTNLYLEGSAGIAFLRSRWNIGFDVSDQGILTSEQDESANFLNVDDTRRSLSVTPSVTLNLTPKDQLSVNMSVTDIDFDEEFNTRFDYTSTGAGFFYNRLIDERHSLGVTAFVSRYRSETLSMPADPIVFENDTDGRSFTINYSYKWSETTALKLGFGEQTSDLDSRAYVRSTGIPLPFSPQTSSFSSTQYSVTVTNETEHGAWDISTSRSVNPSSTGTPVESWRVRWNYERPFTPKLTGIFRVFWQRQEATGEALSQLRGDTRFVRTSVELSWKISRRTYLVWNYSFRQRNSESTNLEGDLVRDATSNELVFGARYKFGI
jgi:hypothetical protein